MEDFEISPYVSVIVPVYKVEKYIERCASSLFEQTLVNLEYIFVDDCTPDKSISILKNVLEKYPDRKKQVHIITHSLNKGIATARNTGLNYAKGEYVAWVDSDDWIEPSMFFDMYHAGKKYASDIVWCDFYNIYETSKELCRQNCQEDGISVIKNLLLGYLHGAMWFSIVKRNVYIDNGIHFPDGLNVMEDKNVLVKLFYYAKNIKYLSVPYYYYMKYNSNSITSGWDSDSKIELIAILNLQGIFSFLIQMNMKEFFQKEMEFAKLIFKKNKLNSLNMEAFKDWEKIFSESNDKILICPNMTLKQKVLGWCVNRHYWLIIKIWIFFKK